MDRYLLKNIIIIILALVNLFLLGTMVSRWTAGQRDRDRMEEQLVALFAADRITLETVPHQTPPNPVILTRDRDWEYKAAVFFLGDDLVINEQGGGVYTYTGSLGTATFRPNGGFEILGTLAQSDVMEQCERFSSKFSCTQPVFISDGEDVLTGTALCVWEKLSVYNCTVTFTVEEGVLTAVTGTLLPQTGVETTPARDLLTAPAALTTFQLFRRETSAACSAVTGVELCYEWQSGSTIALTPVWRIITDVTDYYVNCVTGAVTSR